MPTVDTRLPTVSDWLKDEYEPYSTYARDEIIINQASETVIPTGTVIGKITATGKYIVALAAAVDGSEVPAGIFMWEGPELNMHPTIPATTDTKAAALLRGPSIVGAERITYDAGFTADEMRVALELLGIKVEEQLEGGLNV